MFIFLCVCVCVCVCDHKHSNTYLLCVRDSLWAIYVVVIKIYENPCSHGTFCLSLFCAAINLRLSNS